MEFYGRCAGAGGCSDRRSRSSREISCRDNAFKNAIYELVADEPELKEMAIAIFEVNALKPREIASVCMTTTEDIQNRKRRLGRLLEEHDFKPKRTESV